MSKSIALHLGTHKSASTHLTFSLALNEEILRANSTTLIPPKILRDKYQLPQTLNAFSRRGKSSQDNINTIVKQVVEDHEGDRLILSEENLLGFCSDFKQSASLYSFAQKNLQSVAAALSMYEVEIYICYRNFKSFLPSAYSEYIRKTNKPVRFEEFVSRLDFQNTSWREFHKIVKDNFPEAKIFVWDFESIKDEDSAKKIMGQMCANTNYDDFLTKREKTRPGLSSSSIELLLSAFETLEKEAWNELRELMDKGGRWVGGEKYMPWSVIEQLYFDDLHNTTMREMKRDLDINFIE